MPCYGLIRQASTMRENTVGVHIMTLSWSIVMVSMRTTVAYPLAPSTGTEPENCDKVSSAIAVLLAAASNMDIVHWSLFWGRAGSARGRWRQSGGSGIRCATNAQSPQILSHQEPLPGSCKPLLRHGELRPGAAAPHFVKVHHLGIDRQDAIFAGDGGTQLEGVGVRAGG